MDILSLSLISFSYFLPLSSREAYNIHIYSSMTLSICSLQVEFVKTHCFTAALPFPPLLFS